MSENKDYGYVSKEILENAYFNEDVGLARVKIDGKYGFIDTTGKIIIPLEHDHVWDFEDGLAKVEKDDRCGFVDTTGKVVVPLEYDDVRSFYEGLAEVEKDGKSGFVDITGKIVVPLEYDDASYFYEGLAKVKKDDKYGLIDTTGKVVIPLEYDDVERFSEGLARVKKAGKWGCVDKTGKVVIAIKYDEIGAFDNGVAIIKETAFINKEGNLLDAFDQFFLKTQEYGSLNISDKENIPAMPENVIERFLEKGIRELTISENQLDTLGFKESLSKHFKNLVPDDCHIRVYLSSKNFVVSYRVFVFEDNNNIKQTLQKLKEIDDFSEIDKLCNGDYKYERIPDFKGGTFFIKDHAAGMTITDSEGNERRPAPNFKTIEILLNNTEENVFDFTVSSTVEFSDISKFNKYILDLQVKKKSFLVEIIKPEDEFYEVFAKSEPDEDIINWLIASNFKPSVAVKNAVENEDFSFESFNDGDWNFENDLKYISAIYHQGEVLLSDFNGKIVNAIKHLLGENYDEDDEDDNFDEEDED